MKERFRKDFSSKIGEKIRKLRKSQGLSQSKLAEYIGVSYQQIQKYESGRSTISIDRLFEIADALKIPIISFFEENTDRVAEKGEEYKTQLLNLNTEEFLFLKTFKRIKEKQLRSSLIKLVKAISEIEREKR